MIQSPPLNINNDLALFLNRSLRRTLARSQKVGLSVNIIIYLLLKLYSNCSVITTVITHTKCRSILTNTVSGIVKATAQTTSTLYTESTVSSQRRGQATTTWNWKCSWTPHVWGWRTTCEFKLLEVCTHTHKKKKKQETMTNSNGCAAALH